MIILPKIYTREFPLSLFQLWGKRYKHIFGKDVPLFPRNISFFQNGMGDAYRHPSANEAMNTLALGELERDAHYIERKIEYHRKKIERLRSYYEKLRITSRELSDYINLLFDCWEGFYLSLYVYPDERFSEEDREACKKMRKDLDQTEYVAFNYIESALKGLYPHLGGLVRFISLQEVVDAIAPDQDVLASRQKERIILVDDEIISLNRLQALQKEFDFEFEKDVDVSIVSEIKGQVAYGGKVVGGVRVLKSKSQISELQVGEVLVTAMTTPEYLPAMHKAVAIVTDEGGVLCHAAIASRELKKPCIIGTKIATQVLKDGDLVEVDADKGIVKILEKSE